MANSSMRLRAGALALVAGGLIGLVSPRLSAKEALARRLPTHVVSEGETLWDMAARYGGTSDPRRWIWRVQSLNRLRGAVVMPGQTLILPSP